MKILVFAIQKLGPSRHALYHHQFNLSGVAKVGECLDQICVFRRMVLEGELEEGLNVEPGRKWRKDLGSFCDYSENRRVKE